MSSNREKILLELERIERLADISYITGGGWEVEELLTAIRKKAEKIGNLVNEI